MNSVVFEIELIKRLKYRYLRCLDQKLWDEIEAQASLRSVANGLTDGDMDELFELARVDGIMPIVRRTARFNRHRDLIRALLNHPPARRLLMKRVLGWGRTA